MRILGLPSDVGRPGIVQQVGTRTPLGPCAQYRIAYPLDELDKLESVQTDWGEFPLDYVWEYAREFDIIILQRHATMHFRSLVEHCRLFLKKKVVWDLDDVLLHLDNRNPLAYRWWGDDPDSVWEAHQETLKQAKWNDSIRQLNKRQVWYLAQENRNGAKWMFQNVDLVTCTTQVIADIYAEYTNKFAVLPNFIRACDWENLESKTLSQCAGKVVIGWAGGASHGPDLKAVVPAIVRVLKRFPETVFVIVGYPAAKEFFPDDVPVFAVDWCPIDEYRGWVAGFDIGIAPTQKILTNHAKSGIRIYEYALAKPDGMAVIASPWPYKSDVHKGMGIVAPNNQKFEKALVKYIQNETLRKEHGVALREHVLAEHTERNALQWLAVYENRL